MFRINFSFQPSANIKKKSDHASARVGPTECIVLDSMTIYQYIRNESGCNLTFRPLKMHKLVFIKDTTDTEDKTVDIISYIYYLLAYLCHGLYYKQAL